MKTVILRFVFIIFFVFPFSVLGEDFTFAYISLVDDPHYETQRRYTGLKFKQFSPPIYGVQTAMRENRILGRSLGISFKLLEKSAATTDGIVKIIRNLKTRSGVRVFLLDLPSDAMKTIMRRVRDQSIIFFNFRNRDNELRNKDCVSNLYHTIPSYRMLTDSLAQYLFKKRWKKILILRGPFKFDNAFAESFLTSARRMNLKITGDKKFTLSNDPRNRELANINLLTSEVNYDVVFIADHEGEFSRYAQYSTFLARPVVGDEGLRPSAWHWTWERHGALQLNQRFRRLVKDRHMSSEDWAAWVSIKSVVRAIREGKSSEINSLKTIFTTQRAAIDTYKGNPSSFRFWDNQLRQPILMHTYNAVIDRAPFEGFLHAKNNLDTLGQDQGETRCNFGN